MSSFAVEIRIPGKIMLGGEYTVLHQGGQALACAIDRYLCLKITERGSGISRITSNLWDQPRVVAQTTDDLLISAVAELFPNCFDIEVESELAPSHGFGSSSAICLALALADRLRRGERFCEQTRNDAVFDAWLRQKNYQGISSGYDIWTQMLGGVNHFLFLPVRVAEDVVQLTGGENFANFIQVFVADHGVKTFEIIGRTIEFFGQQHLGVERLVATNNYFCGLCRDLLSKGSPPPELWTELLNSLVKWREIFSKVPDFPDDVAQTLASVAGLDRHWSYKTSGAGGRDALLVFCRRQQLAPISERLADLGWSRQELAVVEQGAVVRQR